MCLSKEFLNLREIRHFTFELSYFEKYLKDLIFIFRRVVFLRLKAIAAHRGIRLETNELFSRANIAG